MRRLINQRPGRGEKLLLGALPFLALCAAYLVASRLRDYRPADILLHFKIAELAGSPSLGEAVRDVQRRLTDMFAASPVIDDVLRNSDRQHAAIIDAIIAARVNPGSYIDWNDLLSTATNDPCYGPSISYSDHDDGTPASGTLPGGDLGMFKDTATDSQPCSVAELKARTRSTKHKTAQGLIIAAAMRKAVRDASLAMPDAGASIDITTQMQPVIQAANANASVSAATISKSSGGHYTYRLRATDTTANVTVELLLTHRPGASATAHGGTLTITVSSLTTDAAAGCTDQMSGANYKVSSVQTVRYRRASDTIDFSARQSRYCGHGDTAQTNLAATIAALDSNDELDPAVKLAGNVRGSSKGWRGDFSRAAGTLDRVAQDGNFLYAWQAGTGDSHSRMFAVTTSYNSTSETRTGKAFFGYAAAVDTTIGSMLGMICNWAGPGNVHTPNSRFQYQTATLSTTGTRWTLGTSKIRYAPTNSCDSSSTMEFDANADNTLGATEGNSTTNDLDSKGSSASVAAELAARGFTVPTFF